MEAGKQFSIGYSELAPEFHASVAPTPVSAPKLLRLNAPLAESLGLSPEWLESPEGLAVLAGNAPLNGTESIAMAYAGHQFGGFSPSLGDGRAILIGEAQMADGTPYEIQLKGAGRTPFSRQGDGRSALGPVLREYVLSEAMHAMGVPTTRALAMVASGESVVRERVEPGGIFTRVARGHVRVGTFEYFLAQGQTERIRELADFVIARRYPSAAEAENPYIALLDAVIEAQVGLIARWMHIGFIHGVMNTDNMSVMGETIDYGPCAFMEAYQPNKVFSSIDHGGRYAYDQQPAIGLWNLTRFAEALLPLISDDSDAAVEKAKESLGAYSPQFDRAYREGILRKVGLRESSEENLEVASRYLNVMAEGKADFTLAFRRLGPLAGADESSDEAQRLFALFENSDTPADWLKAWRARLAAEGRDAREVEAEMNATNPVYIPRNHRVQQAIDAAIEGDLEPLDRLCAATARPFDERPEFAEYATPALEHELVHRTFCGT